MKNIFAARKDFVEGRKRNTFDLSFQNNLTMRFGRLYPVFCKEVIPGDSFKIKPTFGLRFMPLVFPIQTRMQANLHFFYVRNRTLWKDWMDFIGRTKDGLVPPYLSAQMAKELSKTGSLGDYFGIPTTFAGDFTAMVNFTGNDLLSERTVGNVWNNYAATWTNLTSAIPLRTKLDTLISLSQSSQSSNWYCHGCISPTFNLNDFTKDKKIVTFTHDTSITAPQSGSQRSALVLFADDPFTGETFIVGSRMYTLSASSFTNGTFVDGVNIIGTDINFDLGYVSNNALKDWSFVNLGAGGSDYYHTFGEGVAYLKSKGVDLTRVRLGFFLDYTQGQTTFVTMSAFTAATSTDPLWTGMVGLQIPLDYGDTIDVGNLGTSKNPFASGDIHISALPFRAYEAIYNAYYRNQQNDPFKINNVPEYNKYITTDTGGEDSTVYDFFNRNWELDFLTSATQTPQQGDITPLVGVSASGQFTFDNGDGTTTTVTPTIGPDGHTLTGISAYEGTTPADGSLPAGVRRLQQLIPYGISINDFRNVNALQRWLETNLRRGYKYRDQIKSHFNVDVEYKELDMPEFIGGMSEPVIVNQINQSIDQTQDGFGDFTKVLGSYAGQASILAQSQHSINHYCDEHGFIIGILSVSPVPNYSQLLPKHLIKDNVLDYYFPEFGHIGNQPITYREVAPVQSFINEDDLDDVFGYQRAWYDYIASVDEVHGDMRLSLRNFLINRVFNERPELGREFLQVDNDQINDVFSVTDQTDKIIGQVYFDVMAQREIPKFGIPRLE